MVHPRRARCGCVTNPHEAEGLRGSRTGKGKGPRSRECTGWVRAPGCRVMGVYIKCVNGPRLWWSSLDLSRPRRRPLLFSPPSIERLPQFARGPYSSSPVPQLWQPTRLTRPTQMRRPLAPTMTSPQPRRVSSPAKPTRQIPTARTKSQRIPPSTGPPQSRSLPLPSPPSLGPFPTQPSSILSTSPHLYPSFLGLRLNSSSPSMLLVW